MTRGPKALVLVMLVSMTGCPAEGDGEMDGAQTQGTDETTGESPEEAVVEACGLAAPCSAYLFACNPINTDDCAGFAYPEGLVCALETLAAGEQAQLYVSFNAQVNGEIEWVDIAVYGPDTALYQYGIEDPLHLSPSWNPAQRCALKAPEYFEACLADAGDQAQHIACMNPYEWFESCAETAQCP